MLMTGLVFPLFVDLFFHLLGFFIVGDIVTSENWSPWIEVKGRNCLETVLENSFMFFRIKNNFLTSKTFLIIFFTKNNSLKICSENRLFLETKMSCFQIFSIDYSKKQLKVWRIVWKILHHTQ